MTWINNPAFGGRFNETDPLIGERGIPDGAGDEGGRDEIMTIQADPLRARVHGLDHCVTVKGGAYCFLPGMSALRYVGSLGE